MLGELQESAATHGHVKCAGIVGLLAVRLFARLAMVTLQFANHAMASPAKRYVRSAALAGRSRGLPHKA
jgi:hypothetical protein